MSKCLRMFGAYSFRLTRKHSTLLLITSFIVILTIIMQLYAYRHNSHPHFQPKVGDFDYAPGVFLKGQQPNENTSYCEFNYGLPDALKWDSFQLYPSPGTGKDSPYRVIYNAIRGKAYANHSKHDAVTYVTQATPEFLYHIIEITRFWDGPISLSVFVPHFDLDITMQIMNQLCHCYIGMSKVSLHLFYPQRYPPKIRTPKEKLVSLTTQVPMTTTNIPVDQMLRKKLENYRNLNNNTRAKYIQWVRQSKVERMMLKMPIKEYRAPNLRFDDCSGLKSYDIFTFRKSYIMIYPINVGRNVARNASTTNYFLVSDIEMVPSDGLAPRFLNMIRKLMGNQKRETDYVFAKTVFVVPLFEVERGEAIPRDKETLVRMVATDRAMYFHQKACSHCQRFPGLQTWLMRPSRDVIEPMLIAKREYPYHRWEPLYFGTNKEPWYSEMLSWEGRQDKMPQILQMCLEGFEFRVLDGGFLCHSAVVAKDPLWSKMLELCLQEYRMVILDGGFLCHAAVSRSGKRHTKAERVNAQKYTKIIKNFMHRYENRKECKLMWGCKL